jgi:pantoate--beta-alanine ligase
MSSRNVYLTPAQREAALVLRRSLLAAQDAWAGGERDADALRQIVSGIIEGEPLAQIDYVSLADDESLEELHGEINGRAVLSLVVRFGKTRLLDNLELA